MMLKEKSNPWARLKYLYVLPLAAITVAAFARPEVSKTIDEISAVKVNDLAAVLQEEILKDTVMTKTVSIKSAKVVDKKVKAEDEEVKVVFVVVEQMPEFPGGVDALRRYISHKTSESIMKEKRGFIIVNFTVSETGKVGNAYISRSDEAALNEEALRIVRGMPDWTPGKQRGVPVAVKYSVPVRFSSGLEVRGGKLHPDGKEPLVLIDGKEMSSEGLNSIDPNTIESISVLKDSVSKSVYGNRGSEGIILVTTKQGKKNVGNSENVYITVAGIDNKDAKPDFLVSGTVVDDMGNGKPGVSIIIPGTYHGTITDKDGHFKMKAFKNGDLFFSFVGYKSVKAPVSSTMKVQLEQEVVKLLY